MSGLLLVGLAWSQEPPELAVWHAYRGQEREALEQLLQAWDAQHPEVVVRPLMVPSESYTKKLETASPHGNGPDLFLFAQERVGDWSQTGLVVPLTVDTSGFHPNTVEALTYEDQLYAVPLAYKCLVLFINQDLVQVAPGTTDELLAVAAAATQGETFGLAYEASSAYANAAWLNGHGGGIFLDGSVALDQPGNAEAMRFVKHLALDSGVVPQEPTGALVTELFNDGRAAMVLNGPWFLGEIEDVDYRVAPLPTVSSTGLPAAPWLTVEGAFVSGYARHPELAQDLAEFLATPESARVRAELGRQPVATRIELDDPILAAFAEQLERSVPMPTDPDMGATWEPMARAWRRLLRGDMSPELALSGAQTEFEIVTRPPPPPADPRPWLAALGLAVISLLGFFGWKLSDAGLRKEMRGWSFAYGYVAPAAVAMAALVVLPFVLGAGVSLFSHSGGEYTFVGLAHYVDIVFARDWDITSPQSFYYTMLVTLLWTGANVALHVTIGVALAMLLREPWVRLRGVFRVLLILPWAIPNYITALIWKGMFHFQFGAINGLLGALGVEPVSWFGSFTTAFAANLATNTWLGFPFMMVVTLGALQSIPRDLEQAAEVDGANGWQRFRHVTLPLLKPALLPAVILGSVWTFNMFNIIYLVSGGEPDGSTEILISEAYRWAFDRQHQYGYAAAYAVLIFFALLAYSRSMNRVAGQKVL
jgi:arabinogalactan oligomer/maltooligosaccharide transport system permease protein